MYLAFEDYQDMGGALPSAEFARAEFAARKQVDAATFGRVRDDDPQREAVRMLVFELVERGLTGSLSGADMTSASNGGVSVSYAPAYAGAQDRRAEAARLIASYLSEEADGEGVPLLYAGNV